jgi:glycosyltransferase involved in cell wall biosynthesis
MSNTTISVVLPNYNHAEYIGEALEAILSQSVRPKEVIVVDDNSTDGSIAVIEKFLRQDSIIRLIRNERNRGVVYSMNRALKIATGDYVNFAGADDKIKPGLFEKSINILQTFPQAGLSSTDPTFLDSDTGEIIEMKFQFSKIPRYFSPKEFRSLLKREITFSFPTNTVLYKRTALMEESEFRPELRWYCDWFTAFVIAFRYGFCYIPENLGIFRMDPSSYHMAGMRKHDDQYQVLENFLGLLDKDEYSDVKHLFKAPAVLSRYGFKILYMILNKPRYWHYYSIPLVLHTFAIPGRTILQLIIPSPVKRLVHLIRSQIQKEKL